MNKKLTDLILEEVKIARPMLLFRVFRHDKDVKRLLGVKKLRKRLFYDLADNRYIIRGKGELVVNDDETARVLLNRIKSRLRYEVSV